MVRKAGKDDLGKIASLAVLLCNSNSVGDLIDGFSELISGGISINQAFINLKG